MVIFGTLSQEGGVSTKTAIKKFFFRLDKFFGEGGRGGSVVNVPTFLCIEFNQKKKWKTYFFDTKIWIREIFQVKRREMTKYGIVTVID